MATGQETLWLCSVTSRKAMTKRLVGIVTKLGALVIRLTRIASVLIVGAWPGSMAGWVVGIASLYMALSRWWVTNFTLVIARCLTSVFLTLIVVLCRLATVALLCEL